MDREPRHLRSQVRHRAEFCSQRRGTTIQAMRRIVADLPNVASLCLVAETCASAPGGASHPNSSCAGSRYIDIA